MMDGSAKCREGTCMRSLLEKQLAHCMREAAMISRNVCIYCGSSEYSCSSHRGAVECQHFIDLITQGRDKAPERERTRLMALRKEIDDAIASLNRVNILVGRELFASAEKEGETK